jgi:hypothetical protein
MRFRGTLLLLVMCVALGAFVYFYEIKGGEQRAKAKEAANQVWKVEGGDIQQLDLVSQEEHVTAVRSGEKQWKLSAPRAVEADSDELNRIAGSASSITRESVTEAAASDLARFGLEPPQHSLHVKTKAGQEYKIRFGHNNPAGSSTYACLEGSKEVFLVVSNTASNFRKKFDDLRNRNILSFDQYEAQSLKVNSAKGAVSLIKENDRWWLQGKEKWSADSSEVNTLLSSLSSGRLKEFFEDNPDDYPSLGFEKPTLDIRATVGKDKAIRHLQVGLEKSRLVKKGAKPAKPATDAKADASAPVLYVARDESRSELFVVDKEFVDKFLKSANDLRNKALAAFQRWDVDDIVLTNSKGTVHLAKSDAGSDWLVGEDKKKAKWDAANGILDALEKQVKQFVEEGRPPAAYGLDKPGIRVVLKQKGEEKVDCSFGNRTNDGIYAMVKGESSIKLVDKEVLDKLDKEAKDFIEPPPAPAAAKSDESQPKK